MTSSDLVGHRDRKKGGRIRREEKKRRLRMTKMVGDFHSPCATLLGRIGPRQFSWNVPRHRGETLLLLLLLLEAGRRDEEEAGEERQEEHSAGKKGQKKKKRKERERKRRC